MNNLVVGHYYKRVYSDGKQIIFQVKEQQTLYSIRVDIIQSRGYNHNIAAMYVTAGDAVIDEDICSGRMFAWTTTEIEKDDLVWELLG